MQKILVTGASGYIGTGVINRLISKETINIVATDLVNNVNTNCRYIQSDIFEADDPYEYFGKPDILLHLAWRNGFLHNADTHVDDIGKHYHFIKKMCEAGIRKVCVLGSVHEIGFYEGVVNENTPTNPQSNYGVAKNALRNLTSLITRENNVLFQWIRAFYIVGNTDLGCSVFSKITLAEKNGEVVFPFTKGTNQFDFIDYEEFCNQIVSVILQDKVLGIINCCSGYPQQIGQRVESFIKENNYKIKLDYGKFPDRLYDSKAIWGDNSKICKIMTKN